MFLISLKSDGYSNVTPIESTSKVFPPSPPLQAAAPSMRASPTRKALRRIAGKLAGPGPSAHTRWDGGLEPLERAQRLVASAVDRRARLGRRLAVEAVLGGPVEANEEPADRAPRSLARPAGAAARPARHN